jgi:hypothetical protein
MLAQEAQSPEGKAERELHDVDAVDGVDGVAVGGGVDEYLRHRGDRKDNDRPAEREQRASGRAALAKHQQDRRDHRHRIHRDETAIDITSPSAAQSIGPPEKTPRPQWGGA